MKHYLYAFLIGMAGLVWACGRNTMTPKTGAIALQFDHVAGAAPLALGNATYTNAAGEPFTVSRLDYFVSNIRLRRADGSEYVIPQDSSYFLVRASDEASRTLRLNNLPEGAYTGLSFMVGVDSLRSVSGIEQRKGVLDPGLSHTSGMYWDWNTGYIFLKLEGTSPAVAPDATGQRNYRFHVGLFGGYRARTLNNLRTVTLDFGGQSVSATTGPVSAVQIRADVLKIFDGPKRLSLAQKSDIMVSPESADVANNYARMFSFRQITPLER